jgi:uncharacterized protein
MTDPTAPVRHGSIDALRGLAVMGILLMNIASFALPSGAYFNPLGGGGTGPADLQIWAIDFLLVDGKMRALFSILFGASMALVIRRAEEAGRNGTRIHAARMATLLLFGMLHFYLIWQGDILILYALIGFAALPFVHLEPREQIRVALLLLATQLVIDGAIVAGFWAQRTAAEAPDAGAAARAAWDGLAQGVGRGLPDQIAQEIARMRGPWTAMVRQSLSEGISVQLFQLAFNGPETLAYMLIGMTALSTGFLTGGWSRARYLRAAAIGFAIGLPPMVGLYQWSAGNGFDDLITFAAGAVGGVPFRPVLALAEAALALAWLGGGGEGDGGPVRTRLRAVGRMAFSNYLGTSLLMTFLFYGWGLGLFGRIDRLGLLGVVAAAWALMLLWSPAWLARHRYGPLEWIWRSLARGKIQPLR